MTKSIKTNFSVIFFILLIIGIQLLPIFLDFISIGLEKITSLNDYARITDVDYKAVLVDEPGEGGKVVITERLTYDIHAASKNNLFWELWRDLPEDYVDGLKVDYQVNYVKQIKEDGSEIVYQESPKLYWDDSDYTSSIYGPGKWYHSEGPYNESTQDYECIFFYVDGLYRGTITFEIQYEMHNASLRYSDVSELYLTMYSEDTINYLESFHGEILIPQKDMPSKGNYLAHTFGTNAHTFDYEESDELNSGYHTFAFDLDKDDLKFKNYNQYLEFTLLAYGDDKHIFTDYAPDNYYSNDVYLEEALLALEEYDQLPQKARNNKYKVLGGSIILSLFLLFFVTNRNKKIRKKHHFYKPSMKMQYFREIPSNLDPYFAAKLVFSKQKHKIDMSDSYSAILLSLVRKGYIALDRIDQKKSWENNNIVLKILYEPNTSNQNIVTQANIQANNSLLNFNNNPIKIEPTQTIPNFELYNKNGKKLEKLSPNEEAYFNLIIHHATTDSISMKDFQNKVSRDYDNTDSFVTTIENSTINIGISQGYFQKIGYDSLKNSTNSLANFYIIMSILIIVLGNMIISFTRLDFAYGSLFILGIVMFICAIILKKQANQYILLTQFGEDEYEKWHALYQFLNSATLMNERTVIDLPLWEKYLVYATAFGISDKVIKALKLQTFDVTESPILSNPYYFTTNFRVTSRSFRTATHRASSISRTSRYHGGSYYGGGGRGGGGGGGGH